MEKLKMHTPDRTEENFEKLSEMFPNAVTETKDENGEVVRAIDADVLRQEISATVVEGPQERYQFTWPDKKKSVILANQPIAKTLRLDREKSVGRDGTPGSIDTENIYIEGDNLDALKLLQETYLGKVKLIYIDPPYNTGSDSFVYDDDRSINEEEFSELSGLRDDDGNLLYDMRTNNESNGRFHTDWLNMMYPRLRLAKDLMSEDGVIFISIDDNEQENLKKICDEIFGVSNFVENLIWKKVYGIKNDSKWFSHSHDYILVYCKSKEKWHPNLLPRSKEADSRYKNPDNDPRGPWKAGDFTGVGATSSPYTITSPSGKAFPPPAGKHWIVSQENYEKLRADNRIWFGSKGDSVPSIKRFLSEVKDGMAQISILDYSEVGHSDEANRDLNKLMGGKFFDYPKPTKLLYRLLYLGMGSEDIVLDFFSGSATTAHAAIQLNAENGGHRKFIMIQLPEICDKKSEAYKAGYRNICEIGEERIRRAGKKVKEDNPLTTNELDVGFRVFHVDDSNMKDVYYRPVDYNQEQLELFSDNVKSDRTPEDLLYQVMLDLGILLSNKVEEIEIAGKLVFSVSSGYLMACFDSDITDDVVTEIAKQQPFYAVFRDSGIASDSVMANFEQIFETYSPNTQRKVL